MKLIELSKQGSKNRGKHFAQVDDEDYEWLNQWYWMAVPRKGTVYVQRRYYDEQLGRKVQIQMHRVILGITDPEIIIDHKDHNGLNCQRNNIRIATRTQNACNSRKDRGKSIYIGVYWKPKDRKFEAYIRMNNIKHYIGRFDNEETAAKARDKKAIELHGEFAHLNFPNES